MATRIPGFYLHLRKQYPDYFEALENLGDAAGKAGPLDTRTAQLVQLGAAAAIRSEGAVHSHARRALDAGATPDELCHALLSVTNTIGFPTVTAAISWVEDVLEKREARRKTLSA